MLVGANGSGKSTILRSVHLLQPFNIPPNIGVFFSAFLRAGAETADVLLELGDPNPKQLAMATSAWDFRNWKPVVKFVRSKDSAASFITDPAGALKQIGTAFHQTEPSNFIYPYFSRRKPAGFQVQINRINANSINETFDHLPSKIDRLANPDHPRHDVFRRECFKTLGLKISCTQWGDGKQVGLTLADGTLLPIEVMGEGTLNILALLAHLASASGQLFLIEELENDIHPKALKVLLEFIIEQSTSNQFIVSTHSNIVSKYLGSADGSKLFSMEMSLEADSKIPCSSCRPVPDEPQARIGLLENLGYDQSDFYLWKGYLILEESTAERVIRDFLIPFLVPNLRGRLKTIAAQGVADVEARLSDLMRLFVFVHTTPQYKERAWVAVDGGEHGANLVSALRAKFKSWPEQHFKYFTAQSFEEYYPPEFLVRAQQVLAMPHGLVKQAAKGDLADEVVQWALADPLKAQTAFKTSAKEVLDFLAEIAAKLV